MMCNRVPFPYCHYEYTFPYSMAFAPMIMPRLGLGLTSSCLRATARSSRAFAPAPIPFSRVPLLKPTNDNSRSLSTTIADAYRSGNGKDNRSDQGFVPSKSSIITGLFLGVVAATPLTLKSVSNEEGAPPRPYASPSSNAPTPSSDPAPESIVNVYQLSFGTLCGLCAGIFIKKGLKFIAFLLGGGFVLLQYLSSQRLISVNWGSIGKRYDAVLERAAGPRDSDVKYYQGSMAARLWNRLVDFLTANFQERASLLAGLALGLRLG